jgi:LmbE family N-acetylglucosaminyl deacetylase
MRLLCVTAHPDDEAGGFGGTLQHYAARGVETHVLCLTAGTAATNRGGAKDATELAAMRRREFAESCRMLGVTRGEVLDFPDGGLERLNFLEVVADLTRRVREICPEVMMTIGGEGAVTAHPDHTMVSLFTTAAYHWAGRSNRFVEQLQDAEPHRAQKLYYATALFTLRERQPVALAPVTCEIQITRQQFETKVAAFKAHTSQSPLFPIFENAVRQRGLSEVFHLAAAVNPRKMERETDLFAGI